MQRDDEFKDFTLRLFRIPLLGVKPDGKPFSAEFKQGNVISYAKSLMKYRIYNQELHDKIYDLALTMVPTDSLEKEKFLDFLFYCASKEKSPRNYQRLKAALIEHKMFDKIQSKQNVYQMLRAFAYQNDFSRVDLWRRLVECVISMPDDYMTESKTQLLPMFALFMQETEKSEYENNLDVTATRAMIQQMEGDGKFKKDNKSFQSFVALSKAHLFCFHLLTSKEVGYKDVHMEVPILNGLTYADIYIKEIDLAIMVDGPSHYYLDEPRIRAPDLLDRILDQHMDVLRVDYDEFNTHL
jgi:hypothetical protein